MKVVAIIPAYNEGTRLKKTIEDVCTHVDAIVVVDDCSRDNTCDVAYESGVHVLCHKVNRGQGAALQTGMDYALEKLEADIIVHFDADGQMRGEDIPRMIQPILSSEAEVALGSRFLGEAKNIPFSRRLILRGGILFTVLMSGIKLTDTHNGFRALHKSAAEKIRLRMDRMAHASEILDHIALNRFAFKEIPVTIEYTDESLAKGQKSSGLFRIVFDMLKGKLFR